METRSRSILAGRCAAGLLACALGACSSSTVNKPLQVGPATPAAQGKVGVERTNNGNMKVDVSVKHLAPPDKVAQGATTYVVWAEPGSGAPARNLGVLKVGKDREGQLKTKTVAEPVTIAITPEQVASAEKPTHKPVLSGAVNPFQ